MLKKLLMLLLALCLTISPLAGCGRDESDDDNDKSDKKTSTRKQDDKDKDDDVIIDKDDDEDQDDDGTSNADLKGILSFDFPDGWEESETQSAYMVNYQSGSNSISVMEAYTSSKVKNAWDLAEEEGKSIREYFDDVELTDPVEFDLDGYDAVRMDLLFPITDSLTQRQVYVYFFKGKDAYKIMGTYFENDEEGRNEVEATLKTAKVN